MGIFSSDEEPMWSDVFALQDKLKYLQEENETLKKKLQYSTTWEYFNKANRYKQALEEIRSYCEEQNLKADYTACFITNRIDEVLNDRD